jgi:hypothetical protein
MGGSITAIVGANGDGKTLGAVALHAVPALRKERPVVATFHINHPLASIIDDPRQLRDLEHCLLILDEINAQYPSRGAMQLPPEMLRKIHQLRKPDVDVVYTCVDWARTDVALREATKRVTRAKGYMPEKWEREQGVPPWWHPNKNKLLGPDGKPMRREAEWDSMRLFRYQDYNTEAFDQFNVHAIKTLKPLKTRWYWRPWHDDDALYDTLEEVQLWRNVDDHGTCLTCGGRKSRPPCSCTPTPRRARVASSADGAAGGAPS